MALAHSGNYFESHVDGETLQTAIGPLSFSCGLEDTRQVAEQVRVALERYAKGVIA